MGLRTVLNKSLLVSEVVLRVSDVQEEENLQRESEGFGRLVVGDFGLKPYLIRTKGQVLIDH